MTWRELEARRQRTHPEQVFRVSWSCHHAHHSPPDPFFQRVPTFKQMWFQTMKNSRPRRGRPTLFRRGGSAA